MDEKMYEGIIERLDEIEKKLDEILLRLPPHCYTATWPAWDYTATLTVYLPESTAIDYGNESDS